MILQGLNIYSDHKLFWDEVSPGLLKEEAKHNLGLGLAHQFIKTPDDCIYQSAYFEKGKLEGSLICGHYRTDINLVISSTPKEKVSKALFEEFQKMGIKISGFVGDKQTAETYKKYFEDSGLNIEPNMNQGIYQCKKVVMPKEPTKYTFRTVEKKDISILSKWLEAFHSEAAPLDPPVNGKDMAEMCVKNGSASVIEVYDNIVSIAYWGRDIGSSACINLVYTSKEHRNNGFGSLVTAHLTKHLLDGGKKLVTLYTDMSNKTSNKIYQDIGFELVCESTHFGVCRQV